MKTRQGAVPAVMAAPMTSSLVLPAGISWPSTSWSACAAFQLSTMALPQATSCSLLEYQMVIGPLAAVASVPEPASSPPPQAASDRVTVRVAVSARAFKVRRCTVVSLLRFRGWRIGRTDGRVGAGIGRRRRGLGDAQLGRGKLHVVRPAVGDELQQRAGRRPAPGHRIGDDGGQGGIDVPGDVGAVEAGHGDVVWAPQASSLDDAQSRDGHRIAGVDDRGRSRAELQQAVGGQGRLASRRSRCLRPAGRSTRPRPSPPRSRPDDADRATSPRPRRRRRCAHDPAPAGARPSARPQVGRRGRRTGTPTPSPAGPRSLPAGPARPAAAGASRPGEGR